MHKNGVCHRDIKPKNIFISKDYSSLKILDFNVAIPLKEDEHAYGMTGE